MTTRGDYAQAMSRALELAANGPRHGVNPQVGCVILNQHGTVIAEGWHRGVGTPHAEVDALSHLTREQSQGATAVVTLEPCNHTGHTGPCTVALIAAGIARVVYAVSDPGHVSGGGAARLREAGVDVIDGVLADEVSAFLGDWLAVAALGRPIVTVKWASSLDGRVAAADGTSRWITSTASRRRVHEERLAADAILVGTGTVLADDPALTARAEDGDLLSDQPLVVVVGEREIPREAAIFRHPRPPMLTGSRDLPAVLADLRLAGIRSAYVEGGPKLTSALIAGDLVDRYYIYLAPTLIGGPRTATGDLGVGSIAEQRGLMVESLDRIGDDIRIQARPASRPMSLRSDRSSGTLRPEETHVPDDAWHRPSPTLSVQEGP